MTQHANPREPAPGHPAATWLRAACLLMLLPISLLLVRAAAHPHDAAGMVLLALWLGASPLLARAGGERRRADEALRASEERFRAAFDQNAVGMFHTDPQGRFQRVNRRFCAITGYGPDELLGRACADLTHPDDRAALADLGRRLLHGEAQSAAHECRCLHSDGSTIWVNLTLSTVRGPGGEPAHIQSAVEEVTGRKLAEWTLRQLNATLEERVAERTVALSAANSRLLAEVAVRRQVEGALRESEARFRRLADNAPDIIYRFEYQPEPRFAYISPALEALTGYRPDECYADPWLVRRILQPADRQLARQLLADPQALRSPIELRLSHRDGSTIWIELRNAPLLDERGAIVAIEGIARDISGRKQSLEALREGEQQYRALLESLEQGVVVFQDERIVFCNTAMAAILGRGAADLVSSTPEQLWALVWADDRERLSANFSTSVSTGTIMSNEPFRFYRPDGELRWLYTASRIIAYGGRPALLSVVGDITELKRAEEALRQSRDELRVANLELARAARLKDEFLANVSHELRTPLNAILGRAEILAEGIHGPLSERQLRSVASIEESGRHLRDLINDLLDIAKIEADKLDLQHEPVSVADLCEASVRLVGEAAIKKGLKLRSDLDPQVAVITGDPRRLKQILVNLLANAVKFTPAGGGMGLQVRGDREAGTATFTVWDTGIGIAEADLPRLFRPFEQLDSKLSRQYEGTGLGLSLVARLTRLHGGNVAVVSAPDQGSRFSVTLPWAPKEG
ncbi:MAG TPA: PAS domain S-box protein [Chloroflexaceae bacterium]|nr:PAS domain S-box protein [Chloroflexaceae bacterium]